MEVHTYHPTVVNASQQQSRRRRLFGLFAGLLIAGCLVVLACVEQSVKSSDLNALRDRYEEKMNALQEKLLSICETAINASHSKVDRFEARVTELERKQKLLIEHLGYIHNFNEWSYKPYPGSANTNWENAQAICQAERANLVSVHSIDENQFLQNITKGFNLWIGLKLINNQLAWIDESATDFVNWADNQPYQIYNGYIWTYMTGDGKWRTNNQANMYFVCKKRFER